MLRKAKVIHADIDPAEIGKVREPEVPIVGDAKSVIKGLIEKLGNSEIENKDWLSEIQEMKKIILEVIIKRKKVLLKFHMF